MSIQNPSLALSLRLKEPSIIKNGPMSIQNPSLALSFRLKVPRSSLSLPLQWTGVMYYCQWIIRFWCLGNCTGYIGQNLGIVQISCTCMLLCSGGIIPYSAEGRKELSCAKVSLSLWLCPIEAALLPTFFTCWSSLNAHLSLLN